SEFPPPRYSTHARSPIAVIMLLPPFGRMSEVALCVSVSAPENSRTFIDPGWQVFENDEIVVDPEIVIVVSGTEHRSVVVAETSAPVPPPMGGFQTWLTGSM